MSARRERRGWSQEKLAEKAGVSRNAISDIENGDKFARAKTLVNIARAFETEVYELLKPETVLPDKPEDILEEYREEVREKMEEIGNSFMEKLKR
ncbi:MAG: helix-turn-helix transcriptional regulator [Treponema sp.]|nr:helix-turn-helix transcriptional regulator [Treponema sp.]